MASPDVNTIQMSPAEDDDGEIGEPEEEVDDEEGGRIAVFLENPCLLVSTF
jgi:hypothetical protein